MEVRLELLGGFRLLVDDEPRPLVSRKAQILLARLGCASRHGLGRSTLGAFLWEAAGEEQARASLRQCIAQIRRALRPREDVLVSEGDRLSLDPRRCSVDARELQSAARAEMPVGALPGGAFLEGLAVREPAVQDWILAERRALEAAELALLERLTAERLRAGRLGEALELAGRALERDPLSEGVHRLTMRILKAQGKATTAIRQFQVCRDRLQAEMGVQPQPETIALYNEIRAARTLVPVAGSVEAGSPAAALLAASAPSEIREVAVLAVRLPPIADPDLLADRCARLLEVAEATRDAHGGTILPGGDLDLFVVYGLSRACENEAGRAIGAAREILAQMPDCRMGCARGRALHEPGPPPRIVGEVRREAGELAGRARAGEILGDETVKALIERGAGGRARPDRPAVPFVGRRIELSQFLAAARGAVEEGEPALIALTGEPGIGKSALAAEFARRFAADGGRTARAGFTPMGNTLPVHFQLARTLSGPVSAAPAGEAAAAMRAEMLGAPEIEGGRALLASLEPDRHLALAAEVMAGLVADGDRPTLLLVEDTHWAEEGDLDILLALADRLAGLRTVLLVTERAAEARLVPRLRRSVHALATLQIDLAPLKERDALALAQARGVVDEDFARAAITRAGGNPLLLVWLLEAGPDSPMPPSVVALVQEQLDRQGPDVRQLLREAAILGPVFSPEMHAEVFGTGPVVEAIHACFLTPLGARTGFAHALVHEAIYAGIPRAERRRMHDRVADHAKERDPVIWADHALLAERADAAAACIAAAERLLPMHRMEAGARYIEAGLAVAGKADERALLFLARGSLERERGDLDAALEDYDRAAELAASADVRVQSLVRKAWVLRLRGALDEADADLAEARALPAAALSPDCRSELENQLGAQAFVRGAIETCLAHHAQALAHAEGPLCVSRAHGGLGDAHYAAGRMRSAMRHYALCREIARKHGYGVVELSHSGATARHFADPGPEGIEIGRAAVERAALAGNARAELIARQALVAQLIAAMTLDSAEEEVARTLALVQRLGAPQFAMQANVQSAAILALRGDRAGGARLLRETVMATPRAHAGYFRPVTCAVFARLTDVPSERAAALADTERTLAAGAVGHAHLWGRQYAAEACLLAGDWDGATLHADRLAAFTAAEPLVWSDLVIERIRLLVEAGRGRPDETARTRARDLAARLEAACLRSSLPGIEAAFGPLLAR